MRVLLTANASYEPPKGGSTRSNLVWLRQLARAGHTCRVVAPSIDDMDDAIESAGVTITRVHNLARRAERLEDEIQKFQPDWVLVSSEDVSHILLARAHRAAPGRIVYLAHTPQFFPFGPQSWNPDARSTQVIRDARAVVAIGAHMADYIQSSLGRSAEFVHPPIYGQPPFRQLSNPAGGVLMINPCAVKGIGIFAALARELPGVPFDALAGWGTTPADRALLTSIPNIAILESVPSIEDALRRARILLMPSLWYEGFGLIVMEAMLRGLPVVSSDSGGLAEAKAGTGYVIPVRPIERYEAVFDETHMPHPVIPEQDIAPWTAAVKMLLEDHEAYEEEARRSRRAAETFVSGLREDGLERLLRSLGPAPELSTERAMLLERLRRRGAH